MAATRIACIFLAVTLVIGVAHASPSVHSIVWETGVVPFANDDNTAHVEGADILTFISDGASSHDIMEFASSVHYDTCNFTGASDVLNVTAEAFQKNVTVPDEGYDMANNTVKWHYFGCSVGGHCASGQKVKVMVHKPGTMGDHDDHDDHDDDHAGHDHTIKYLLHIYPYDGATVNCIGAAPVIAPAQEISTDQCVATKVFDGTTEVDAYMGVRASDLDGTIVTVGGSSATSCGSSDVVQDLHCRTDGTECCPLSGEGNGLTINFAYKVTTCESDHCDDTSSPTGSSASRLVAVSVALAGVACALMMM